MCLRRLRVWKIESTRLIAAIARVTHDIGIAEELAQDALLSLHGHLSYGSLVMLHLPTPAPEPLLI